MSTHGDFRDELPQRQGMSSTAKVLLILGSIGGVCALACCGGGVFLYFKAKDVIQNIAESASSDPEVIKERTEEIIHIDIPNGLAPMNTFGFFGTKSVIYGNQSNNSMLMIMEMNLPMQGAATGKQQREEMLRAMRQQGQQHQGNMNGPLNEESSETREFTINGQKVPFEFIKGTSPGNGVATRQIVGIFPGRQGTIMVNLMQPESEFKEENIVKMIESIRLPEDDDADDDSEMSGQKPEETSEPAHEKAEEAEAPAESSP